MKLQRNQKNQANPIKTKPNHLGCLKGIGHAGGGREDLAELTVSRAAAEEMNPLTRWKEPGKHEPGRKERRQDRQKGHHTLQDH